MTKTLEELIAFISSSINAIMFEMDKFKEAQKKEHTYTMEVYDGNRKLVRTITL